MQWNKSIIQKHYFFLKIAGFWGFTNSAGTPETETRADQTSLVYKIMILPNWCLNTHLSKQTCFEFEFGTWNWHCRETVSWKHYKNLPVIKSTKEDIICLNSNLNLFSIDQLFCIDKCLCESVGLLPRRSVRALAQRFLSSELYLQILTHLTGWWKMQNMGKLQKINFCFIWNLYMEINYKNWTLIFYVSLRYEWNKRRAHFFMSGYNVSIGYSSHTSRKCKKSTLNS